MISRKKIQLSSTLNKEEDLEESVNKFVFRVESQLKHITMVIESITITATAVWLKIYQEESLNRSFMFAHSQGWAQE